MTEDQIKKLIDCGAFNYSPEKIANVTGLDPAEVADSVKKEDGEIYKLLKKGQDIFDYQIDKKLLDLTMQGDLKALFKLEQRMKRKS